MKEALSIVPFIALGCMVYPLHPAMGAVGAIVLLAWFLWTINEETQLRKQGRSQSVTDKKV
jgi:hypothetical protein